MTDIILQRLWAASVTACRCHGKGSSDVSDHDASCQYRLLRDAIDEIGAMDTALKIAEYRANRYAKMMDEIHAISHEPDFASGWRPHLLALKVGMACGKAAKDVAEFIKDPKLWQ